MKTILSYCLLILLGSCTPAKVSTIWKADSVNASRYQRILVVAILREEDSILRKRVETSLTKTLLENGYLAISAVEEFGSKGLSKGGEENTYLKLCNNGIDAVMTITLISRNEGMGLAQPFSSTYPNQYFYQRIWNYNKLETLQDDSCTDKSCYFLESVFFDLAELEVVSANQSQAFEKREFSKIADSFTEVLVNSLKKQKILLAKQPEKKKAF